MAEPTKTLKDAAYVVIGLGVIATQKVNVRRQELRKQLETQRKQLETQAANAREIARTQLLKVAEDFESRIEPIVDQVEERLPAQAARLFKEAREQVKGAQETVKSRLAA